MDAVCAQRSTFVGPEVRPVVCDRRRYRVDAPGEAQGAGEPLLGAPTSPEVPCNGPFRIAEIFRHLAHGTRHVTVLAVLAAESGAVEVLPPLQIRLRLLPRDALLHPYSRPGGLRRRVDLRQRIESRARRDPRLRPPVLIVARENNFLVLLRADKPERPRTDRLPRDFIG